VTQEKTSDPSIGGDRCSISLPRALPATEKTRQGRACTAVINWTRDVHWRHRGARLERPTVETRREASGMDGAQRGGPIPLRSISRFTERARCLFGLLTKHLRRMLRREIAFSPKSWGSC